MNYSKIYIKNWFLENNPSFKPNIDAIYTEVANQLEGLEPTACRIVLSSFLALNYSNKYKEQVEFILVSEYAEIIESWRNVGIYTSELGCILRNLEFDLAKSSIKSIDEVIKACIQDCMITNGEIVMDDFTKQLREDSELSDEDRAKFADIERLYQENSLAKNQRICPKCQDVIESKHTHDFVQCKCGALRIDGGLDYTNVHIFF